MIHSLQSKQVLEIDYLSRKFLTKEYPELIKAPSVTQWLKDSKSDAFFRHQMKNPNSVIAKAVKAGKNAHSALETGNAKSEMDEAVLSCFNDDIMPDIDKIVGREQTLVHPVGYNGKFDLMCQFRGEYTIIDYKKTNKKRTPSTLKSYFMQLMAYRFAHNWLYPSHTITQVGVVNLYGTDSDSIKSNVTVLTESQMEDYESQFLLRVASGKCVGY
jgi:hypothetical protein